MLLVCGFCCVFNLCVLLKLVLHCSMCCCFFLLMSDMQAFSYAAHFGQLWMLNRKTIFPLQLQENGYDLPSHDALAQILPNDHHFSKAAKPELHRAAKQEQERPAESPEATQANKPDINHTYQVHQPHKRWDFTMYDISRIHLTGEFIIIKCVPALDPLCTTSRMVPTWKRLPTSKLRWLHTIDT